MPRKERPNKKRKKKEENNVSARRGIVVRRYGVSRAFYLCSEKREREREGVHALYLPGISRSKEGRERSIHISGTPVRITRGKSRENATTDPVVTNSFSSIYWIREKINPRASDISVPRSIDRRLERLSEPLMVIGRRGEPSLDKANVVSAHTETVVQREQGERNVSRGSEWALQRSNARACGNLLEFALLSVS